MMRQKHFIAAVALLTFALSIGIGSIAHADYQLGPRDKVRIKVSEWRQASGQLHEWSALSGEFMVSQEGTIALPIVGTLPAATKTSPELAELISDRLRETLGLANRPTAAVELVSYRPFYIVGEVERPGEFEFRPGMTVIEAISLAGGLFRSTELRRLGRETIASDGDLRVLINSRLSQLARQARLRAELNGKEEILFPSELLRWRESNLVAELITNENSLFASRRKTLQSKLDSFARATALLYQEVEVLESKRVTVDRQFKIATQELENINKLIERKLAVSSRQLALEQTVAQFESSRLDLGLAIVRAQQEISRAQRDATDAVNTRNNEALTDLGNVEEQLASIDEKRITLQRLIDETRFAGDIQQRRLSLTVIRKSAHGATQIALTETDALQPGDVLKVGLELTGSTLGTSNVPAFAKEPNVQMR